MYCISKDFAFKNVLNKAYKAFDFSIDLVQDLQDNLVSIFVFHFLSCIVCVLYMAKISRHFCLCAVGLKFRKHQRYFFSGMFYPLSRNT